MHIDMERSREEYRSRYRNRRYQDKHRLVTDNQRRYLKQSANNSNPSRYSPNHNSISSRHFHYSNNDDDYRPHSSSSSSHFSISNRAKSANTNQINCYESYSPSSRHDRSLNYREVHSPYVNEQSIRSNNFFPPTSSHQRTSPISSSYNDSERNQYISSSSSSSYRRDSSPPPVSSHRNGRLIDHEIRNINNDFYIHSEYRSVTPPSLTSLSHPVEAYVDSYRSNDYASRSQRYESPFNRTNPSSSSNYRNSKNIPVPYESYPFERDYRSISNSRNDEISSYNDRRHFKRPSSKYDNEINPSKRFSRR